MLPDGPYNRMSHRTIAAGHNNPLSGVGPAQVIYMTGWAPAASQPAALRRGSATVKLEDLAEMQRQRDLAASGAQGDGRDAGE